MTTQKQVLQNFSKISPISITQLANEAGVDRNDIYRGLKGYKIEQKKWQEIYKVVKKYKEAVQNG